MLFVKLAAVYAIFGTIFNLLPDAPLTTDALVIPDFIWNPLLGVLGLNRYFPVSALIAVALFDVAWKVGVFSMWLGSWVWGKLTP